MNNQEAFNKAVLGVVAQGGPSNSFCSCLYRAENGRKCAVGHLIPDSEYDPKMEGQAVLGLVGELGPGDFKSPPALAGLDVTMLMRLQVSHDNMISDRDMPRFLNGARETAKHCGLTFPEAEVQALLDKSNEAEAA